MRNIATDPLNTILVISKGRPNNLTANYLSDIRYKYWALVIEDDEEYRPEYYANYGSNHILEFHRDDYENFDTYDIYGTTLPTGCAPARNASIDIAKELGLERFWTSDDTIKTFFIFKNTQNKKRILNGEELYDYLNCFSKLAKTINAENISMVNDSFIKRTKEALGKQMYGGGSFGSISTDTELKFESRGYEDCARFYNIHRHGKISLVFKNFLLNLQSQSTNSKSRGGVATLRKTYNKDVMATGLILGNPHVFMRIKQRKYSSPGYRLSPRIGISSIRSMILKQ